MRGFGILGMLLFALAPLVSSSAHATVRPPTDSLTVHLRWLDRDSPQWRARLRLTRYSTATVAPGSAVYTALSLRAADSLVIIGADSALIVIPGTQVVWPGYPALRANTAITTALRTHAAAPAGGFWFGALGSAPTSSVLPNEPVDVCWFIRVAAGTSDQSVMQAVQGAWFGSGPSSAAPVLGAGVAFKRASKAHQGSIGGGGAREPMTIDP